MKNPKKKIKGATESTAYSKEAIETGKHPSENAIFYNPVASVNEATGITPTIPYTAGAAKSIENIYPLPVTGIDNDPMDDMPARVYDSKPAPMNFKPEAPRDENEAE